MASQVIAQGVTGPIEHRRVFNVLGLAGIISPEHLERLFDRDARLRCADEQSAIGRDIVARGPHGVENPVMKIHAGAETNPSD
jgi:hypothetical protein